MPKTQIPCPQCGRPIIADIRQIFDLAQDPHAKQTLLSGAFNIIQCPYCGYQGRAETPIVYHDPEKELLLTYFPPALNKSRDEQERTLGKLINQIFQKLPPEKRKGYLLQPQTMLTFQTLLERILEADGITKEMLQEQEKRVRLLERLLSASDDARLQILEQEKDLADEQFFALLAQLLEAALISGDKQSAQHLAALYEVAKEHTPYGQKLKEEEEALKAAEDTLRSLGERTTLEDLVNIFIEAADNDLKLKALAGALRPVMDYRFFQKLSERIDQAQGQEKEKLTNLRARLLELTAEIDRLLAAEMQAHREVVEKVLAADDLEKAIRENAGMIDPLFLEVLEEELKKAREKGDLERSARINKVLEIIENLTSPPPEIALIQTLIETADKEKRQQILSENRKLVNEGMIQQMAALVHQLQAQGAPPETVKQAHEAYQQALKFYMSHQMHL